MIKKIVILSLTGIGNNLLFMPAARALRKIFPEAKISMLVVLEPVKDLFADCPYIDEVIPLCEKKYNNLRNNLKVATRALSLRKEGFDLSVTVFPSNRMEYNLLSFLLGARIRLTHGYPSGFFRNLSFLQNRRVPALENIHDVDQNLNLMQVLGFKVSDSDKEVSLWAKEEDREFAYKFLKKSDLLNHRPLIGFHATSYPDMAYKRWPAIKFANLANELIRKHDARIILFGSKDEGGEIEKISRDIFGSPILATRNTIGQTAEIIRCCHLFVSNDSGLMHLATAVNVPTIGIFGPTNFMRTAPYGKENKVLKKDRSCSPCHRYPFVPMKLNPGCKTIDCLAEIEAKDVLVCVEELLQKEKTGRV
jgi:heptosyltransferase-2